MLNLSNLNNINSLQRGATTPSTPAGYPLNDDGTVAAMFGAGYVPGIAPDYHRSNYTYLSPGPGIGVGVTTPSAANWLTTQAITVGAGKRLAFEAVVHYVPDGGADFDGISIGIIQASGGAFAGIVSSFGLAKNAATMGGVIRVVNTGVADTAIVASEVEYRLGVEFDGDTGNVTYRSTDGLLGTTAAPIFTPGNGISFSLQFNDGGTTPAGKTASLEIVPAAANMVLSYTAGSVDVFGDVV